MNLALIAFAQFADNSNKMKIVLVGNKLDISNREVTYEEGLGYKERNNLDFFETSAKLDVVGDVDDVGDVGGGFCNSCIVHNTITITISITRTQARALFLESAKLLARDQIKNTTAVSGNIYLYSTLFEYNI